MALGRLSVVLDANIAKFESDLGRASRIAQQQSAAMQRSFENAAKKIGATLVSAFAVRAVEQFVKTSVDGMLQLGIAAKQVGMPTEQFTALAGAARRADLDVQSFTMAMVKADKALVQARSGKGAEAAAFKALGIDPKAIKDNNDLILKASDALSKYRDGIGKTALEQVVFGRSGAQLNAFLDQGSAAIQAQAEHMKELGVAFGPDAQAQLAAYDNAQKEFGDTITGLRNKLVIALLPSLQSANEFLSDMVKSMDKDAVSGFTTIVTTLARATIVVAGVFETAGRSIGAFVAAQVTGYKALWDAAKDPLHAMTALKAGARGIGTILSSFGDDEAAAWRKRAQAITDFGEQTTKATAKVANSDVGRKTLNFNPNAGATAKAVKAPTDPTQALRDQLVQLTLSTKQYQLYQLAQKGATDGQLAYASSVIDTIDKIKAQNEAQAKLNDFLDQHRAELNGVTDAEQQFNETMEMANKALQAHAVSWQQFQRIAAGALEDLNGKARDQFNQMTEFAKRAAENMQDAFAAFLFDPFKGGLKGMLAGFADTLRQMAAQALAANIFGKLGAQQGGGFRSGSVLGTLFGAMGAGHAAGGPVAPGGLYPVNERGPELLSVAGKDFLMMGAQGGNVTPNHKLGGGTTINVNVQPTSTRRTASQVAEAVARKQQLALARA